MAACLPWMFWDENTHYFSYRLAKPSQFGEQLQPVSSSRSYLALEAWLRKELSLAVNNICSTIPPRSLAAAVYKFCGGGSEALKVVYC